MRAPRKLLSHGALYFASSMAARGLSFLLTPIYTRLLGPDDYGVLGLASTVLALLALVFGCGVHAGLSRLWFEDVRRDALVSSAVWFLLGAPALVLLALIASRLEPFKLLPPSPHLQLIAMAAWLSTFHALPQTVFQAEERPRAVALFNLALVLVQLSAILLFVVILRQGVLGVLRANVFSHALMAVVALASLRRWLAGALDVALLARLLAFSLPLVPHLVSNWFLSLSDRVLLERAVPAATLGAYSLAYLFNAVCVMACSAVLQALTPLVTRELKADPLSPLVPRLGRLAWGMMLSTCLLAALFAPVALRVLAPRGPLDEALVYVPWVVLGAAFQGAYFIVSQGSWFAMRTGWVAPMTLLAAAANVLANLWLIPRFGAWAAAVNTAAGYAMLMLLHGRLAHALHPIRWSYGRSVLAGVVAAGAYLLGAEHPIVAAPVALAIVWAILLA